MKKSIVTGFLLLLLAQVSWAQGEGKPSVWFLSYGNSPSTQGISVALVDVLVSYGLINPDDRPEARVYEIMDGSENSAIQYRSANADLQLDLVRGMVAAALDHEPDVLVTISAPVTLAALQATADWPDPPAIVFADVYNTQDAGLVDADCLKPAHVTGVESVTNYDEIVDLLLLQNPDLQTVGTIHDPSDASGAFGAAQIEALGAERGLTVVQTAIASLADLTLAMEGLVSKDVEAILLPFDNTVFSGLPIIANVATDAGIPVFNTGVDGFLGSTVAAGFYQYYEQGERLGIMIAAYLNGDLDLASTAINRQDVESMAAIVNLVSAEMLGLEISEALQARADATITMQDGLPFMAPASEMGMSEMQRMFAGAPQPQAEREAADRDFLASLECTAERIAEQQAELDAMEG